MFWQQTSLTPVVLAHQNRGGLDRVVPTQRRPRAVETGGVCLVAVVGAGAATTGPPG